MWNDAELSHINRLLSLENSNVANESIKQREIHILYIFPYLPECLTKSNRLS